MSRLADSPNISESHQAAGLNPRNQPPALPSLSCVRCGGLLVPGDVASLERDVAGIPMTLWRCVNCGDCVDRFILANRWKSPASAVPRVRLPAGPQRTGPAGGRLR